MAQDLGNLFCFYLNMKKLRNINPMNGSASSYSSRCLKLPKMSFILKRRLQAKNSHNNEEIDHNTVTVFSLKKINVYLHSDTLSSDTVRKTNNQFVYGKWSGKFTSKGLLIMLYFLDFLLIIHSYV